MSTDTIWQTVSSGSEDTVRLGKLLGELIKPPIVVELLSDLGGGKTTLVRGLAQGLGVSGNISSPSFTLSREYQAVSGTKLYHFDFYRLAESGVLADELSEAIGDPESVICVEWSQIVQDVLPKDRLTVELKPTAQNSDEREIIIHYPELLGELVRQLETNWQSSEA